MIAQENKYTNLTGVFPNAVMIDATGAGLTDGSEFAALPLNDGWEPFSQAIMDYSNGGINAPTGSVGVPNGVSDAKGVSQIIESIQKAHGIGPGNYVPWANEDDPSITGDRVLLLSEQGVLIATYPALDAATYVGDPGNTARAAAGGKFYRSSDSGGATPNIAGPYLQLPAQPRPTFLKPYSEANGDFTVTGPNSWATTFAIITPYQILDGSWRAVFNISGTTASASLTIFTATVSGILFSNIGNQIITATPLNTSVGTRSLVNSGTATMSCITAAGTRIGYGFSGDVALDSKPTFADDFEYIWGIRY